MVVYYVLLQLGDMIFGLVFLYGGYLMYGMKINVFGWLYDIVLYEVLLDDYWIDMDEVECIVCECWFKFVFVGWLVYLCVLDFECFCVIVDFVGV